MENKKVTPYEAVQDFAKNLRKAFGIPEKKEELYDEEYDMETNNIYADWHTKRYFLQCFYNLQEKFDCYGMSHDEWRKIRDLKIEKYGE